MQAKTKRVAAAGLVTSVVLLSLQIGTAFAASTVSLSQTISDGVQSVDFVDASGGSVASPGVSFGAMTFDFDYQTANGTLGTEAQKIRIANPTSDSTWSVVVAATGGPTSTWSDGLHLYDYNDSYTDGGDDTDSDSVGGRLSINPSVATMVGLPDESTCSATTGITKGSSSSFQEIGGVVNSITLVTGGASATPYCAWDMTGIDVSQVIPARQDAGTYGMGFTITLS
ncbi:MAG: hypothetical protein WCT46_06430 [Candidatus Gracilibacteria bacterium]